MPDQQPAGAPPARGARTGDGLHSEAERQLFLVDQMIGLRARLAEETVRNQVEVRRLTKLHEESQLNLHLTRLSDAELRVQLAQAQEQARERTQQLEQALEQAYARSEAQAVLLNEELAAVSQELHQTRLSDAELRDRLERISGSTAYRIGRRIVTPLAAVRRVVRRRRS